MISSGIRKGTRVVVTGRFVQRDWQTETGEKRSSFELNADDIGASVRYATVQITKANESAATPPAPQSQPTQPAQPTQEAKDDPCPTWSRTISPNHRNRLSEKKNSRAHDIRPIVMPELFPGKKIDPGRMGESMRGGT